MAEARAARAASRCSRATRAPPDAVAAALSAMTFAIGRRFVIADGVERWKEADVDAGRRRDGGRWTPRRSPSPSSPARRAAPRRPTALHKAVEAAGGDVAAEMALKARELPQLARRRRPRELGVELDDQARPRARRARSASASSGCMRELEKLALEHGAGRAASASRRSRSRCASSAERKAWTLADALVAGDEKTATRALLELRQQGERLPGLLYQMVRRVRDALAIAEALAAGEPPAQIKRGAADAVLRGRPADRRRRRARRRGLPARARAAGRPRGGEPGRRSEPAVRSARTRAAVRAVIAASRRHGRNAHGCVWSCAIARAS